MSHIWLNFSSFERVTFDTRTFTQPFKISTAETIYSPFDVRAEGAKGNSRPPTGSFCRRRVGRVGHRIRFPFCLLPTERRTAHTAVHPAVLFVGFRSRSPAGDVPAFGQILCMGFAKPHPYSLCGLCGGSFPQKNMASKMPVLKAILYIIDQPSPASNDNRFQFSVGHRKDLSLWYTPRPFASTVSLIFSIKCSFYRTSVLFFFGQLSKICILYNSKGVFPCFDPCFFIPYPQALVLFCFIHPWMHKKL